MVVREDGHAMVVPEDGNMMVVADNDIAMVVPEDGHTMVAPEDGNMMVVVDDDLAMVVVPDDGLSMANFEMNTGSETITTACKDILQKNAKNRRHKIKKYFDTVAENKVSTKSPVPDLTDGEWQALVEMWSTPIHKKEDHKGEELSTIDFFKATHNNKKHGFLERVKIAIKLERSELQAEVMQEEIAAIKMKAEEYEVARDKEVELLRKKSQGKWYAVFIGKALGVYSSWEEASAQVASYSNSSHRGFKTRQEAEQAYFD
ncbi:hypothetical protein D1007_45690 [Hordeum vulgare]|nr:hypothetical protein D1007_45690 [Hordeum vulgare]